MFRIRKISLPIQLLMILAFSLLVGSKVPVLAKEWAYTLSSLIQDILSFVLPVIIFSYLFSSMVKLKDGALSFVLFLLAGVCISNWLPLLYTYGISLWTFGDLEGTRPAFERGSELSALWRAHLPQWISNDWALLLGLVLGCLFAYFPNRHALAFGEKLNQVAHQFLSKVFIPFVPVLILGFALKLQHEGTLQHMILTYAPLFVLLIAAKVVYLGLFFGIATGFSPTQWWTAVKNVAPSVITGFSTMSSAATLPVTLEGAEKNCERPDLARVIVPSTVNIHMVGDSIIIPLLGFFILTSYGRSIPDLWTFLPFSLYFMISKFAVAGIPGGGVITLLPIFQRHFDFSPEMLSLMTAMYLILDPLNTVSNVAGNGAFAMVFSKFYSRLQGGKTLGREEAKKAAASVPVRA